MRTLGLTPSLIKIIIGTLLVYFFSSNTFAQTTLTYSYDALGRVTFTQDSVNGNRDYDYDAAGNRSLVSVGTANDAAAEPGPPAAPTGLRSSYVADCAYSASWNAVTGISYYNFSDTLGNQTHTTSTSISVVCTRGDANSNKPKWVQSCNSFGCSAKASF